MPTELFANATVSATPASTTLSGNGGSITAGATSLKVASNSGFSALSAGQQYRVLIDTELMIVTANATTTWTVTRGAEGTTAASHNDGATVNCEFTAAQMSSFVQLAPSASQSGSLLLSGASTFTADTAAHVPLTAKGVASQTGDLQQWQNSTPTTLSGVRSDGLIYATTNTANNFSGLATVAKAGVPADSDWATAPPIGTMVLDTTDSKLYLKTLATAGWKGVAIA